MASIFTKAYLEQLAERYDTAADAARSCGVSSGCIQRNAKIHGVKFRRSRSRAYHQPSQMKGLDHV